MSDATVTLPRYAKVLGIVLDPWDAPTPVLPLDFSEAAEAIAGMFHGAAIAELPQTAALTAFAQTQTEPERAPPISITIDLIRATKVQRIYATGTIVRAGRPLRRHKDDSRLRACRERWAR